MKVVVLLLLCVVCVWSDSITSNSYDLLSLYSNNNWYSNDVDDFLRIYDTTSETNFLLNDDDWFDGLKKKFNQYKEKSIKWVAKHGDKVAGVLDKAANVAGVVESVAGITQMVATGASLIPGVNVIAAPIAAASSATFLAAKATKLSLKAAKHGVKVATEYSKGYTESGGDTKEAKRRAKEQLKKSGKAALKFAVSEAASVAMVAGGGALLKGTAKFIPKSVKSKLEKKALKLTAGLRRKTRTKFPNAFKKVKKFDQKMLRIKKKLALKKSLKRDAKIAKKGAKHQMKIAKKLGKNNQKLANRSAKNNVKAAKNKVSNAKKNIKNKQNMVKSAQKKEQQLAEKLKNAPNRKARRGIEKEMRKAQKQTRNAQSSLNKANQNLKQTKSNLTNAKQNVKTVKNQKNAYNSEMAKGKQNANEIVERMKSRSARKTSKFNEVMKRKNVRGKQIKEADTFKSRRKQDLKDAVGDFRWGRTFKERYGDIHRITSSVGPASTLLHKYGKKYTEDIVGDQFVNKIDNDMTNGTTGKILDNKIGIKKEKKNTKTNKKK